MCVWCVREGVSGCQVPFTHNFTTMCEGEKHIFFHFLSLYILHVFFFVDFFFRLLCRSLNQPQERWIGLHTILLLLASLLAPTETFFLSRLRCNKKNILKVTPCIFITLLSTSSSSSTMLICELRFFFCVTGGFCCQRPTATGEFSQFFYYSLI